MSRGKPSLIEARERDLDRGLDPRRCWSLDSLRHRRRLVSGGTSWRNDRGRPVGRAEPIRLPQAGFGRDVDSVGVEVRAHGVQELKRQARLGPREWDQIEGREEEKGEG